jgi:CMP-2-keto-3-deoxyoctulosonic acid synthetase
MKAIALIPARLEASRFPRKLLTLIQGKSVLQRTYESAMNSGLFDDVVVVADHDDLILEITRNGGKAFKSQGVYESGTDRILVACKIVRTFLKKLKSEKKLKSKFRA